MRSFACFFWTLSVILILASDGGAAVIAPTRLESVTILAAGTGSSVAVRTSSAAALVAATAADTRTVVIELVGVASDHRDMTVSDAAGMVSRIAIDAVHPAGSGNVTRIRVSLMRSYRHRVRISGNLVYVDFERVEAVDAASPPTIRPPQPPARTPPRPTAAARPVPPPRPAVPRAQAGSTAPVKAAAARPQPAVPAASPPAPSMATSEVNLLSRWLAVTEPLQHTFSPPSSATVLGRAWMPLVLKDGSMVFSYGDYTEVGDQLAFLLPFDDSDAPRVEAVSLPRSSVDMEATVRASESVRSGRYTLTTGPAEFASLSQEVSTALNAIPSQPDPLTRVKVVEDVRRRLNDWPATHYGYRASDVNEAVATLDPIIMQLRAAAGVNRIDLNLVAPASIPPPVPSTMKFRQPTLVDLIENAMRVVSLLKEPAERTTVLRTTAASLDRHRVDLPSVWFTTGKRRVVTALKSETRIDEAYRKLSADIITSAVRAAGQGNVRAVSVLQSDLLERDRRLGGKRQDVVASTLEALRAQSELAAKVQLRHDHQTMGMDAVHAYAVAVDPALKRFASLKGELQQLDRIAPSSPRMIELRDAVEFVKRTLAKAPPPEALTDAHGLLLTAAHLAGVALQPTVDPRLAPDMVSALRSSAAAESLDMFDRGKRAVEAALRHR